MNSLIFIIIISAILLVGCFLGFQLVKRVRKSAWGIVGVCGLGLFLGGVGLFFYNMHFYLGKADLYGTYVLLIVAGVASMVVSVIGWVVGKKRVGNPDVDRPTKR